MRRRHLLQFTGSCVATLAVQSVLPTLAALSKPGTRKLALLVGINQYNGEGLRSLRGCLMDVEMQRELLISRFGFNPADILMLTDETLTKPTRDNILAAYEQHLIAQAKPNDVVLFHFSGHGSEVADPDPITEDGIVGTLVPIDRPNLNDNSLDITGRSLFLLTQSLQTQNVTTILDACHSGGAFRSSLPLNSRLRAISARTRAPQMGDRETDYQAQLLKKLSLSRADFLARRRQGIAKGVALGSAHRNQFSADSNFGDFYAGAFSYLLTRSLWQAARNESLGNLFTDLARSTEDLADTNQIVQTPVFDVQPGSQFDRAPAYLTPSLNTSAEGVVKAIDGDRLELWLGGIPAHSLEAFEKGAIFNILNREHQPIAQVRQTGRSGLTATGQLLKQSSQLLPGQLSQGQLIQEQVRGVPVDLTLTIGVLPSSIDRVQSSFTNYPRFKFVALTAETTSAIDGVIESKEDTDWQLKIGPDRILKTGDLNALRPTLQSLLAGKVLRSLANGESARLPIVTAIRHAENKTLVAQTQSRSARTSLRSTSRSTSPTSTLKPGDTIEIHIQNNSPKPLYAAAVAIDSSANLIVLYPLTTAKAAPIAPNQSLTIPDRASGATYKLTLQPPAGSLEILTFTSTEPLGDILRGLKQLQPTRGIPLTPTGRDALTLVGNLLGTIDPQLQQNRSGNASIDNSQFALLSTLLQVTD